MYVFKRNGSKEEFDFEKINKVVFWACDGVEDVNASTLLLQAKMALFDGISTKEIHEYLIRAASDLISLDNPNYSIVATKLQCFLLYKEIYGSSEIPSIKEWYLQNVNIAYTNVLLDLLSDEDWLRIESRLKHERDYTIPYAGITQFLGKYLLKNRVTKEYYETPQMAYMLVSLVGFSNSKLSYNDDKWLDNALDFYDAVSTFKINLPTPILAGVRSLDQQFSSCTVIDAGDTIDSIFSTAYAMGKYISRRAGIGLNVGRIRSIGSSIREGQAEHTGKIPFLKMYEGVTKSCSQGGIRSGSTTVYVPCWDYEIKEILVLKNNKGTDSNRVRKMDYGIQLSELFYKRLLAGEDISLFSTSEVPELYEAWGDNDKFNTLYLQYEKDTTIRRRTIKAQEFFQILAQERIGTGRIYVMNIDNCNSHSSFSGNAVKLSNLCTEICLPTEPFNGMDDESGEIALCVLGAINWGTLKDEKDFYNLLPLQIEFLDNIIDIQDYPVLQSRKMLKRRSLGIGINNFSYFLAKNKVKYGSQESFDLVERYMANFNYAATKASVELAKKRGACEWFDKTKLSKGILTIDTYNKNVDEIVKSVSLDWDSLREDVLKFGVRNSALISVMPSESSSVCSGSTNGIEPIKEYLIAKVSKNGVMRVVAPNYKELKDEYTLAYDISNTDINKMVAIIQKYTDQAISVNHYYDASKDEISMKSIIMDLLTFYKYGGKNLYYANTNDGKTDEFETGCESGACAI